MNIFGTDGIRNKVGLYPFTAETLPRLGRAIALWALEKYGHIPDFLLVRDTRVSGCWIKASLSTGLLRYPVILYDAQVLPTPAVFHLMKDDPRYTCGIIISASHNPAEDNGIKIIDRNGKITPEDEQRITDLTAEHSDCCQPDMPDFNECGLELPFINAEERYAQKIISLFEPHFLAGRKIILDCAHGATYRVAPAIFNALGAQTIAINTSPDGQNINKNCGALHVEGLQTAVRENQAFIGFAFDGDGDRVIAVSADGTVKDGDDILALLLENPQYKQLPTVISTIMSNKGFEAHIESLGKKLLRTAVGDKYVSKALTENKSTLGGEPSGHIILQDIIPTGDGILAALKMVETILMTGNVAFHTFKKYPQMTVNVPIIIKKPLNEPPLLDIIAASERLVPNGRVLVRYSGTEPIVRVMVEDADTTVINTVAHSLAEELRTALS